MPDAQILNLLISKAQSAAASLRVKSALNPMLWMCAIVSVPCLVIAYFAHGIEPLSTALLVLAGLPIGATIIGFLYFMIVAPDKLQSEDYQIRHETLELIRQKGSAVEISPSSLDMITNPIRPSLPPRKGAKP